MEFNNDDIAFMKSNGCECVHNHKNMTNCVSNYDETNLPDSLEDEFTSTIMDRGEDYYYQGKVLNIYKSNNRYFAKVRGSNDRIYNIEIEVINNEHAYFDCSCPYDNNCKHEYAVLMAISNREYTEVELKPYVKREELNLLEVIKKIPAEKLKEYLISPLGLDNVAFEMKTFTNYFRSYCPKPEYEYYYNNLYNDMVIDDDYKCTIDLFISRARQFLVNDDFEEVFKIVNSIIEAYNDSNRLNFDDYAFEVINKLGMILRIVYRKASEDLKNTIKAYGYLLESKNYYNNYYLEDLILSVLDIK